MDWGLEKLVLLDKVCICFVDRGILVVFGVKGDCCF